MFLRRDIPGEADARFDDPREVRLERGVIVFFLCAVPHVVRLVDERLIGDVLVLRDAAHFAQGLLHKLHNAARFRVQHVAVGVERVEDFGGLGAGHELVLDAREDREGLAAVCRGAARRGRHAVVVNEGRGVAIRALLVLQFDKLAFGFVDSHGVHASFPSAPSGALSFLAARSASRRASAA